jgi:hypothetical protein
LRGVLRKDSVVEGQVEGRRKDAGAVGKVGRAELAGWPVYKVARVEMDGWSGYIEAPGARSMGEVRGEWRTWVAVD